MSLAKTGMSGMDKVLTLIKPAGDDEKTVPNVQDINDVLKRDRQAKKPIAEKKSNVMDFLNSKLKSKYNKLKDIGTGITNLDTWEDTNVLSLEHLSVQGYQKNSIADKVNIVRIGLESLFKEVSALSVGYLIASAWLVKSPENSKSHLFKEVKMSGASKTLDTLSSTILQSENDVDALVISENSDEDKERFIQEGAYLCAAALRLVTKDAENLKNAWNSLRVNYANFYQGEMLLDIVPSVSCIAAVRNLIQNRTIIRNTLAPFLLNIKDLEGQELGICRMLFEIHLSYTGMHSYNLLLVCASSLKTPIQVLFQLLEHPGHSEALKTAEKIMCEYDFPTVDQRKNALKSSTWKYARIFDSTAFATLQTKNCVQMTSILIMISKKVGTGNSGDPTKINQASATLNGNSEWLEGVAEKIIDYCRSASWVDAEEISGVFR
ncbi:TPA_asm: nucleocapsid protein [Primula virus 1]|uniref:Nucleoprotein n=1 Tax=Primula virus 1 TaxID=2977982 RepID=A0A9N6YJH2_9RHAB|nr:TPA_asm: nucleocapsid protein [Primula virus 1]